MRILVTRPSEDARRLSAHLKGQNIEVINAPLLNIEYGAGDDVDMTDVQAVVLTSANGVRSFAKRSFERNLPVLCVGDATAREATAEHFSNVKSANGDVASLAELVKAELDPDHGALVHPAGTDVAGDLGATLEAAGYTYRREVLYSAKKAKNLPGVAISALKAQDLDGILIYSPRTAQALVKLLHRADLVKSLASVTVYCLSPAVADEISDLNWADIKIADKPNQDALLALL